jgi:antitoxin YefM
MDENITVTKDFHKIKQRTDKTNGREIFMSTINITNARKDLYHLVETVSTYHEPALIVGRKGNAVLISEDDWSAIQETLFLDGIPGMTESIVEGKKTPPEECIPEEMVTW